MIALKNIARALTMLALCQFAFGAYLLGSVALNIREVARIRAEIKRMQAKEKS